MRKEVDRNNKALDKSENRETPEQPNSIFWKSEEQFENSR
jgi:hypothetical protein